MSLTPVLRLSQALFRPESQQNKARGLLSARIPLRPEHPDNLSLTPVARARKRSAAGRQRNEKPPQRGCGGPVVDVRAVQPWRALNFFWVLLIT